MIRVPRFSMFFIIIVFAICFFHPKPSYSKGLEAIVTSTLSYNLFDDCIIAKTIHENNSVLLRKLCKSHLKCVAKASHCSGYLHGVVDMTLWIINSFTNKEILCLSDVNAYKLVNAVVVYINDDLKRLHLPRHVLMTEAILANFVCPEAKALIGQKNALSIALQAFSMANGAKQQP